MPATTLAANLKTWGRYCLPPHSHRVTTLAVALVCLLAATTGAAEERVLETPDSTVDIGTEVYEYEPTGEGYRLNPKPGQRRDDIELRHPMPGAPAPRSVPQSPSPSRSTYYRPDPRLIPPQPVLRPIGKTIVGVVLTVDGGVVCVMSLVTLPIGLPEISLLYLGAGLAQLIPGGALLSSARRDWNIYNDWQATYHVSEAPTPLGVRWALDF